MGISGILTVLWYTALPFLPLIIFAVILLLGVHLIAFRAGYRMKQCQYRKAMWVSGLLALAAIPLIPWLTHSSLNMVVTVFDWVALLGTAIGVGVYAWLVLHPIWYVTQNRHSAN